MRILFVVSDLFFSEPLGVMLLSAIARKDGHQTLLVALKRQRMATILHAFNPDVVAYSAMTAYEHMFYQADQVVRQYQATSGRKVFRIMGGPHATFFQQVLNDMELDAICVGEGDLLFPRLLTALETGQSLEGIPNLLLAGQTSCTREVPEDLDAIPFPDRSLIYNADPDLQQQGIRSFMTQRGCPYRCTYCFNHSYNLLFKGPGVKLFRRRSVDNLFAEIREVRDRYPTLRYVRFGDDVFVIRPDAWLEEFTERYPKEIGIPFYCLIRCNTLTEEIGKMLSHAGCRSISMSIEAGSEEIRNKVLRRHMSDEMMRSAFTVARKYRINAFANTILAIPGTTPKDDYNSFLFAREMKPGCPTFSIFAPYPNTHLTDYAISLGVLDPQTDFKKISTTDSSPLNNYTPEEKRFQLHLVYLGQLFCLLPDFFLKIFPLMLRLPLTPVYRLVSSLTWTWIVSSRIFPHAYPRSPLILAKAIIRGLKFILIPNEAGKIKE